ncbi:hypothetical protein BDC45DRAFT_494116 [Circinella umbellata]|nr:hypothetical protein BDC45DRAFT_494116 [Circinella umbellata]
MKIYNETSINLTTTATQSLKQTYKSLAQEIEETLMTIQKNPHDHTKYQHVAKLYSCQGSQQEAIYALERGLLVLSSTYHLIIQRQLDILKSRLEKRIDFISLLPYEIVCRITDLFAPNQETAVICLKVCRSWRRKLSNYSSIWRRIYIDDTKSTQNIHLALPAVAEYVNYLYIRSKTKSNRKHMMSLRDYHFSNLKFLGIVTRTQKQEEMNKILTIVLPCVSRTLSELDLTMTTSTGISLDFILKNCQNLTSLRIVASHLMDEPEVIKITDDRPLLQLEISSFKPVSLLMIAPLLHHSPQLRTLALRGFRDVDILSVIGTKYCTELEEIRMAPETHKFWWKERIPKKYVKGSTAAAATTPGSTSACKKGGLHCLELNNIWSAKPLIPRLAKSIETLRAMSLTIDNVSTSGATISDWQPFSSFTMHNLQYLHIRSNGCRSFFLHLPIILHHYPSLETIRLESTRRYYSPDVLDDTIRDGLFDAIAQLENLVHLELDNFNLCGRGFERLLMMLQQQGLNTTSIMANEEVKDGDDNHNIVKNQICHGDSSLQTLRIVNCNGCTASILKHASRIYSLQELVLSVQWRGHNPQVTESDIKEFMHGINDLPRLSDLHLDTIPLTEDMAHDIAKSKSIKRLKLGSRIEYYEYRETIRKLLDNYIVKEIYPNEHNLTDTGIIL